MSSNLKFPTPVGGTPFPSDFAPSILFAVLYGLLFPLILYRVFWKGSRNALVFNTATFAIERVVVFSLRATISHNAHKRESSGLLVYMQLSFMLGYLSMAPDTAKLLRVLLVNSTKPSPSSETDRSMLVLEAEETGSTGVAYSDEPRQRNTFRRVGDLLAYVFLAATIVGVIAGSTSSPAMRDAGKANLVMSLRYASASLALAAILSVLLQALYAVRYRPRVNRRAAKVLIGLCSLIVIPPIYRLCVMHNRTDSLISTGSGSLNSVAAKATFYIFHMLPEYLTACVMFGINIRETFNTGPFGDWRYRDETAEEREKRHKKKAEKQAKKDKKNSRLQPESV